MWQFSVAQRSSSPPGVMDCLLASPPSIDIKLGDTANPLAPAWCVILERLHYLSNFCGLQIYLCANNSTTHNAGNMKTKWVARKNEQRDTTCRWCVLSPLLSPVVCPICAWVRVRQVRLIHSHSVNWTSWYPTGETDWNYTVMIFISLSSADKTLTPLSFKGFLLTKKTFETLTLHSKTELISHVPDLNDWIWQVVVFF